MCLTALKKILKQIVQIWYQFDVDGDVVTWPSPWYVTSSGRTNQEQFVRRTQRRRRCLFSARPYVLYPFLTQDTLKKYPQVICIKHPHQNHHHQSLPLFYTQDFRGFYSHLYAWGCLNFIQWLAVTCWQRYWAKVRSHGAFDQLRHQQSKSQFRGLRRRFRRNFHGYRFAMPWIWDLVKNCAWKLLGFFSLLFFPGGPMMFKLSRTEVVCDRSRFERVELKAQRILFRKNWHWQHGLPTGMAIPSNS